LRDHGYPGFQRRLLAASADADVMILRGTSGFTEYYAEAVAATLIKLRRRRRPPAVFVEEALFDVTSLSLEARMPDFVGRLLPRVARRAVRLADGPHVAYGVISTTERDAFEARWGIPSERVYFTPYFATVPESLHSLATDRGYVFAGGNTLRDYELLAEAARGLEAEVKIASTWQPTSALPPNVELSWTDPEEYNRRMAAAAVIVVPLSPSVRSAGQQTYLSAMLLGKPLVVTDGPGVRDYVEAGVTALVVENDADAMREALRYVLDPGNREEVERMTTAARRIAEERYLAPHYFRAVYDAAIDFWRRRGGPTALRTLA
jgi:hypothetical protein